MGEVALDFALEHEGEGGAGSAGEHAGVYGGGTWASRLAVTTDGSSWLFRRVGGNSGQWAVVSGPFG
jgi:hypothetical protein